MIQLEPASEETGNPCPRGFKIGAGQLQGLHRVVGGLSADTPPSSSSAETYFLEQNTDQGTRDINDDNAIQLLTQRLYLLIDKAVAPRAWKQPYVKVAESKRAGICAWVSHLCENTAGGCRGLTLTSSWVSQEWSCTLTKLCSHHSMVSGLGTLLLLTIKP